MKKILLITSFSTLSLFFLYNPSLTYAAELFKDISSENPFFDAAHYFKEKKIMTGFADGSFGTTQTITRAEFVTVTMKAAGYAGTSSNCFPDVTTEWYAPFVCQAKEKGFVRGYANGFFGPRDELMFPIAAVIATHIFGLATDDIPDTRWFSPYIIALEKVGAIPLHLQDFDLPLKRGVAAELLYRLAAKQTNKPSHTYKKLAERDDFIKRVYSMYLPYTTPERAFKRLVKSRWLPVAETEHIAGIDDAFVREIKSLMYILTIHPDELWLSLDSGAYEMAYLLGYEKHVVLVDPIALVFCFYPPLTYSKKRLDILPLEKAELEKGGVLVATEALFHINPDYSIDPIQDIDAKTFARVFPSEIELIVESTELLPTDWSWRFIAHNTSIFGGSILRDFYKDKNSVYQISVDGTLDKIPGIDVETFREQEIGQKQFLFDTDDVFFIDENDQLQKVPEADPVSFTNVSDGRVSYFKDEDNIFIMSLTATGGIKKMEPIKGIKLDDIEILFQTIYRQADKIYTFSPVEPEAKEIAGVNAQNFHVIEDTDNELFSDGENIYFYPTGEFNLKKITSAKGFELLQAAPDSDWEIRYFKGPQFVIFKNDKSVFVPDRKNGYSELNGADISSFRLLDFRDAIRIAQDKKRFYAGSKTLKAIDKLDIKSFKRIDSKGPVLFKDRHRMYQLDSDGALETIRSTDSERFAPPTK